jgi:DNA polymerase III subunit beta
MHLIIEKKLLEDSLRTVNKAVSSSSQNEMMKCILFELQKDNLSLTGYNNEIGIRKSLPNEEEDLVIKSPGKIAIPEKMLSQLVSKLRSETVEIQTDGTLCTIRSGKSKYEIVGLDANDFPKLPNVETDKSFHMDSDVLKAMLRQTLFAVATTDTRPILTGVSCGLSDGTLHFVATDSHRMASRKTSIEEKEVEFTVVTPGKSLTELSKILPSKNIRIQFCVSDQQVMIQFERTTFYSRLLSGTYPDTSRIVPKGYTTRIVLNAKELTQSLESMDAISDSNKGLVVRLNYRQDKQELHLTSSKLEVAKGEEYIFFKSADGEEISIGFNSKYVLEALKPLEGDRDVALEFTGPMSPFILREEGDHDYFQLILPVRCS